MSCLSSTNMIHSSYLKKFGDNLVVKSRTKSSQFLPSCLGVKWSFPVKLMGLGYCKESELRILNLCKSSY